MKRWVEHYSDLNSRENTVSPAAIDAIECLPTVDELESEPLVEELSKPIDSLASNKAPGNDRIPPDLIKHCKTSLLLPLHEVLCQCWQEGAVPQDMRDSKSLPYTRTRARGTTVTTTEASPYSALSAKYLRGSYYYCLADLHFQLYWHFLVANYTRRFSPFIP